MKTSNHRVLLIDDDPICNHLNLRTLGNMGYEVISFSEAKYAIEHLQEIQNKKEELPSLILVDINMPKMNGFECVKRIRACNIQTVKIAFLSSLDESLVKKEMHEFPDTRFINKPLTSDKIQILSSDWNLAAS